MPKLPSTNPNPPRNHITTQARNKIVPALMMKPFSLSHTWRRTVLACGIWYCGSSITNGAGFPENGFVFFRMIAATSTATIPMKYISGAINELSWYPATSPEITPPIRAITGSLAPHGIKVAVIIVRRLSLSCSIVLEAMIPGIPQPDEIRSGIKLFPESPKCLNTRSMTNAIRTMYPQSSRIDKKRNRIAICGTKPRTAPRPPMIPSTTSPITMSPAPIAESALVAASWIATTNTSFVQSVTKVPTVVTET